MLRWRSFFLFSLAWALPMAASLAAPGSDSPAKPADPVANSSENAKAAVFLSVDELASATKEDAISIPTPGEVMAALNKQGKPNWQSTYRQPIPTVYTSRPQIALNLGGLIADGYLAIEAEDSQQVKNIGKDIIALAKSLNVSENVLRRGKSIEEFADNNEWNTLKEELEATQNEVKLTMNEQQDRDLVILVTLGAWIRGTEAISSWIADNYSPDSAKILRQPAVVSILRTGLEKLPEKLQKEPLIQSLVKDLSGIQSLVSFERDTAPNAEDVKKLKTASAELVKKIVNKK